MHGSRQLRNPWSDGLEKIMKCPVLSNTSFTQEIIFFIEEGTLWWHAHSDWSCTTIHGAIIILPALRTTYSFPKHYAEETIVPGMHFEISDTPFVVIFFCEIRIYSVTYLIIYLLVLSVTIRNFHIDTNAIY